MLRSGGAGGWSLSDACGLLNAVNCFRRLHPRRPAIARTRHWVHDCAMLIGRALIAALAAVSLVTIASAQTTGSTVGGGAPTTITPQAPVTVRPDRLRQTPNLHVQLPPRTIRTDALVMTGGLLMPPTSAAPQNIRTGQMVMVGGILMPPTSIAPVNIRTTPLSMTGGTP